MIAITGEWCPVTGDSFRSTVERMRTVVVGPRPAELEQLIARRQALGLDKFDEVWEGDYHMAPAPHPRHGALLDELIAALRPAAEAHRLHGIGPCNLGTADNFRVPDYGYYRVRPDEVFVPTMPIVVEVVSPGDETFEKFGHYHAFGVDELVLVVPDEQRVQLYERAADGFEEVARSTLFGVTADELTDALNWT